MKEMPYRIPEGFIERSKEKNRDAIRNIATRRVVRTKLVQWSVSIAATAACMAIVAFAYAEFGRRSEFDKWVAQMEGVSDELIYEMSSDMVEYPEDMSLL